MGMMGCAILAALGVASAPARLVPSSVGLTIEGAPDEVLAEFLRARVLDAWGVSLADGAEVAPVSGAFRIVVAPRDDGIEARVEEGGGLLAARSLPGADGDADARDALLWLFVKSTIGRALISRVDEGAPGDRMRVAVVKPSPESAAAAPSSPVPQQIERERAGLELGPWGLHVLFGPRFEGGVPMSFSVAAGLDRKIGGTWRLGLEAGYRHVARDGEISVDHFPLSLDVSMSLSEWTEALAPVSIGVALTADIARATSSTSGVAATMPAFSAGPFVRGMIPIVGVGSGELAFIADLGVGVFLQKRKYLVDGDLEISDGFWNARFAAGVNWQWR